MQPVFRDILARATLFSEAVTDFAVAYADQTKRDYLALKEAVKSGRIRAENECKKLKFYSF